MYNTTNISVIDNELPMCEDFAELETFNISLLISLDNSSYFFLSSLNLLSKIIFF
jgi:hypothetical protein